MESAEVLSINKLAESIAALTVLREEDQALTLKDHGRLLTAIDKQLSVLVERTSVLADLTKRVTALELWQSRTLGFAAAFLLIGGFLGWALNMAIHH